MELEVGVGFIGVGFISSLHAAGVKRIEGTRLVGLFDTHPDLSHSKALEYGCRAYSSVQELVGDPKIDAIFVLTPLKAHLPNVKLALEAGKHVLVEKPVGVSITEIQEMKRLAQKQGLVCMPGHNEIYSPELQKIKASIDRGDFGRLSLIDSLYNIQHPAELIKRTPGAIQETGTHKCYTLLYLAGKPKSIQAMEAVQSYEDGPEDIFIANLSMENGVLARIEVNFAADDHSSDPWSQYLKVIGTEGSARYSFNDRVRTARRGAHSHTYLEWGETIANEDAYFVSCIRQGNLPLSTLDDAIMAQEMIDAIVKSIRTGKTVTFKSSL